MQPWERRLRDLSNLLSACGSNYFAPDLFRQNTNQFLQTSRTVTFIIQKNKTAIPDFPSWYAEAVLNPWSHDSVMTWAKDARNVIEKEGDLDMHSTLRASLVFSYFLAQDAAVDTTRKELFHVGIDKLLRLATTKLPSAVADAAVLRIERRWVANSLPTHELLAALTYVYARLFEVVKSLARHNGGVLDRSVPHPTTLDPAMTDASKVRYIKLGAPGVGKLGAKRVRHDPNFRPPASIEAVARDFVEGRKPQSLDEVMDVLGKMAEATFRHYGYHVPMLFLFDQSWRQIDFLSTQFVDQADKFVFWRHAAERAAYLRAHAVVWISESWLRDMRDRGHLPIRDMPIIGEHLNVIGLTMDGLEKTLSWEILRDEADSKPTLKLRDRTAEKEAGTTVFFLKPVLDAMRMARGLGAA